MADDMRVCVVGGGPAGLSIARAFKILGLEFDVYERHSDVGGIWAPGNRGTPMYESAHFISSKNQSNFLDYPMPDEYPDYPSNRQIDSYLRSFASAYSLYDDISLDTEVLAAVFEDDGWTVHLLDGDTRRYSHLICANGTNWHPRLPRHPGNFGGEMIHSVNYDSLDQFKGRRVLVVGAGNSGCDIACDAAKMADAAFISLRRGYHFIPKHLFGIPADEFAKKGPKLPPRLQQAVFGRLLRLLNGDVTRLGLPKPDHKIFESHPIANSQLLHYLAHGDIKAKDDIVRLDEGGAFFEDGSREDVDFIVYATGYEWRIPYVNPAHFRWEGGRPDLYMNLFSRENRRLFGMGFTETSGGAYQLFDNMADLIGRHLLDVRKDPARAASFRRLVQTERPDLSGGFNYVASDRHTSYVNADAYLLEMKRLRQLMNWPEIGPGYFDAARKASDVSHTAQKVASP